MQVRVVHAGRRCSKLVSLITSSFTGHYVSLWGDYLKGVEMKRIPLFDCRAVLYPNVKCLRDYLAWRQADTHINCQYNTCYWLLVKEGMEPLKAQEALKVCFLLSFWSKDVDLCIIIWSYYGLV